MIRLPLPGEEKDPIHGEVIREMLQEFAAPAKVLPLVENRTKLRQSLVLMHEIIGHGSGTFNEEKYKTSDGKIEDPISGLGSLGSALEEQRADLTSLVFAADPKIVEMGFYKSNAEAKQFRDWGYDFYLADFLRRTSGQRTFTESHQRGHLLFINKLLEAKAIAWKSRIEEPLSPANAVLTVKDPELYWKVAYKLLEELQDIKANRKEEELRQLFARYAPLSDIDSPCYKAIIERGKDLKINAGYVEQPWGINSDGEIELFGELNLESIAPFWDKTVRYAKENNAARRVRAN